DPAPTDPALPPRSRHQQSRRTSRRIARRCIRSRRRYRPPGSPIGRLRVLAGAPSPPTARSASPPRPVPRDAAISPPRPCRGTGPASPHNKGETPGAGGRPSSLQVPDLLEELGLLGLGHVVVGSRRL